MLARFAYLYRDEIRPSQLPSKTLLKIQHLLAYRQRLVKNKVALEVATKELVNFVDKEFRTSIIRDSQKHIDQLMASMHLVDKQPRHGGSKWRLPKIKKYTRIIN